MVKEIFRVYIPIYWGMLGRLQRRIGSTGRLGRLPKRKRKAEVNVTKTTEEEMQLDMVNPYSETSYYEVTHSNYGGDGVNVELTTCADIAESVQVGHATKDVEDYSEQEAEHHAAYDDVGRMSGEEESREMEHGRAITGGAR